MNNNAEEMLAELELLLQEELGHYLKLIDLSRREQSVLIKGEVNELFGIIQDIENITIDIRKSEGKRIAIMEMIKRFLDMEEKELTISQIINYLAEPLKSRYKDIQEKLLKSTKEVHYLNEYNASLVKHSLEYTNYLLSLFTGAESNTVYCPSGELEPKGNNKLIDQHA